MTDSKSDKLKTVLKSLKRLNSSTLPTQKFLTSKGLATDEYLDETKMKELIDLLLEEGFAFLDKIKDEKKKNLATDILLDAKLYLNKGS